jgi:hypothetical protein
MLACGCNGIGDWDRGGVALLSTKSQGLFVERRRNSWRRDEWGTRGGDAGRHIWEDLWSSCDDVDGGCFHTGTSLRVLGCGIYTMTPR